MPASPGIIIVFVLFFVAVRHFLLQAPEPASARGQPQAPAQNVPDRDTSVSPPGRPTILAASPSAPGSWESLRSSCRCLRLVAQIALTVPVWLVVCGVAQALFGELPSTALLGLAVATVSVVVISWEDPTRQKNLRFARDAVTARGIAPELLTDETFIGAAATCSGEHLGSCSDIIGFIELTEAACVLHTTEKDTTISRDSIVRFTRCVPRGDTMGWVGVQAIGVTWRSGQGDETEKLYLIARYSESAYAIAAATDMLCERVRKWAPEGVPLEQE